MTLHAFSSPRLRSQPPDLVDGLGGEGVALDLQALQVFRQLHLEPEDLQREVGVFEEPLTVLGVLPPDQGFQQVVEVALDPLAQDEAVVAGEFAGMDAGLEDQVVSLGDHDQFLVFFH